jgi:hypothetical protein
MSLEIVQCVQQGRDIGGQFAVEDTDTARTAGADSQSRVCKRGGRKYKLGESGYHTTPDVK